MDSQPGNGTRFELYFPALDPPAAATPITRSTEVAADAGGGVTVLVADDEAALRQAVVQILRTSGYRVLEAETSIDALELAKQHAGKLDVLLTDIVMPGLRGPDLARRVICAHPKCRSYICRVTPKVFRNRHRLKTLSFCKSHFVLQPCWNSLNSFGAGPDLLQFITSRAGNHA